jgi:hypothetical protein
LTEPLKELEKLQNTFNYAFNYGCLPFKRPARSAIIQMEIEATTAIVGISSALFAELAENG